MLTKKKQAFIEYLTPLINEANKKVLTERALLLNMRDWKSRGRWIRPVFLDQLIQLAAKYRVKAELLSDEYFEMMLLKIDAVPLSLAVAQAATESGWGTSRFARQGNNFFGQWCFKKGCGLVPQSRKETMRHEVARFDSALTSVESYVLNLNRHSKYSGFREERAKMRTSMQPLSGLSLVSELHHYSERRQDYIQDIKSIIQSNNLSALDS
jgi:Bax protein